MGQVRRKVLLQGFHSAKCFVEYLEDQPQTVPARACDHLSYFFRLRYQPVSTNGMANQVLYSVLFINELSRSWCIPGGNRTLICLPWACAGLPYVVWMTVAAGRSKRQINVPLSEPSTRPSKSVEILRWCSPTMKCIKCSDRTPLNKTESRQRYQTYFAR